MDVNNLTSHPATHLIIAMHVCNSSFNYGRRILGVHFTEESALLQVESHKKWRQSCLFDDYFIDPADGETTDYETWFIDCVPLFGLSEYLITNIYTPLAKKISSHADAIESEKVGLSSFGIDNAAANGMVSGLEISFFAIQNEILKLESINRQAIT